jgi:site-specific DNA-cytosine methylase
LLEQLEGIGGGAYNVSWDILNTRDYGIPQNRERIFFIGILKSLGKIYTTPVKREMASLDSFMIDKAVYERTFINASLYNKLERYKDVLDNYIVLQDTYSRAIKFMCPTIRTGCLKYYYQKT